MNQNAGVMKLPLWLYVIGWLGFVYLFINILNFSPQNPNNLLLSGLYFIQFGVHEISHLAVFFLPAVLVAAAGSVGEIGFTLLMLFVTIKQKAYFASVFVGLWVMMAFMSMGRYMADARAQQLPLIGPGETVQHDWNYVFSQTGLLATDTVIGGAMSTIGIIIGVVSLATGLYLIVIKATYSN